MSDIVLTAYDGAILGPIAKVLGFLMNQIYVFLSSVLGISNISVTIIIFTVLIYMCLFPLTYKQQKFSKISQKMQPELQKVQKKYQGKKDQASLMAMQEENRMIQEKYGVSPTGSCIYMLINLPILFALLRVFYNLPAYLGSVKAQLSSLVQGIMATPGYQELMQELVKEVKVSTVRVDFTVTDKDVLSNYIVDTLYAMHSSGWDLLKEKFAGLSDVIASTQDNINHINNFMGMNISDSPMSIIISGFKTGAILMVVAAVMIPVFSYLTQVLSMKLMPQPTVGGDNDAMAQQMNSVNKFMPLVSLFFCFSIPVGLGVYWIFSALVRSVQQILLNKHFEKVDLDDIIKQNQEKARKKREKMGISENQINNAAHLNTRKLSKKVDMPSEEKERLLNDAAQKRQNAKKGSMSAKADLVKEFNERNSK